MASRSLVVRLMIITHRERTRAEIIRCDPDDVLAAPRVLTDGLAGAQPRTKRAGCGGRLCRRLCRGGHVRPLANAHPQLRPRERRFRQCHRSRYLAGLGGVTTAGDGQWRRIHLLLPGRRGQGRDSRWRSGGNRYRCFNRRKGRDALCLTPPVHERVGRGGWRLAPGVVS